MTTTMIRRRKRQPKRRQCCCCRCRHGCVDDDSNTATTSTNDNRRPNASVYTQVFIVLLLMIGSVSVRDNSNGVATSNYVGSTLLVHSFGMMAHPKHHSNRHHPQNQRHPPSSSSIAKAHQSLLRSSYNGNRNGCSDKPLDSLNKNHSANNNACRNHNWIGSILLGCMILLMIPPLPTSSSQLTPSSSQQFELQRQSQQPSSQFPFVSYHSLYESYFTASAASGDGAVMTSPPPTSSSSSRITNAVVVNQNVALVDEVWSLIDKYYIDRSLLAQYPKNVNTDSNNADYWDSVRIKYRTLAAAKAAAKGDNPQIGLKLAAEMVSSQLQDKYSRILDPRQYAAIQKYDLIGIGVSLMPNPADTTQMIVGSPPVPQSQAAMNQLQQGDIISSINGISTTGKTAFDIIAQISQDPNAPTITMTVVRNNNNNDSDNYVSPMVREVTMQRTFAEIKNPIQYQLLQSPPATANDNNDRSNYYGYIKISEFNSLVKGNIQKAIIDLEDLRSANDATTIPNNNMDAYIIDLRQNTGGAFQSAIEIASLFMEPDLIATYVVDNSNNKIPLKTIATTNGISTLSPTTTTASSSSSATQRSNAASRNTNINDNLSKMMKKTPLLLLIDARTASASEVLASALHDNCRAVVVGTTPNAKSFGKGLIQAVYGLQNYNAGLVLTVARYVTPSGQAIQGVGITPDLIIPDNNQNNWNSLIQESVGLLLPSTSNTQQQQTNFDTSKINVNDIQQRLSQPMCMIPDVIN